MEEEPPAGGPEEPAAAAPPPGGASPAVTPRGPPREIKDQDLDWQDLHKWVANGKDDDIDKAGNVLFEPK